MIDCDAIPDPKEEEVVFIEKSSRPIRSTLISEIMSMKVLGRDQELSQQRTTYKVALGNLFVCGYRVFKRMKSEQCLILFKKSGFQTKYAYFTLMENYNDKFPPMFFNQINFCIKEINHLKNKPEHIFTVIICYTFEKSCIEITNSSKFIGLIRPNKPVNKDELLKQIGEQNYIINNFSSKQVDRNRELEQDSEEQFGKIKNIIYHYIDTFGQKYKTNYYADLEKKCLTSYRISYLINTINSIIYEETGYHAKSNQLGPTYSQIESSSWTIFNNKEHYLSGDRKDMVLTGNGRILIMDIIFLKNLKKYINEDYLKQVELILRECDNAYLEGKVKVVKIDNEINNKQGFGLVYRYEIRDVKNFCKILTS